jgi:uncharacterized protein YjbJ (UPF0337 family)
LWHRVNDAATAPALPLHFLNTPTPTPQATFGIQCAGAISGGCHMNKDELDGKADALKGRVKQGVGDLTDNDRLHDEGVADEAAGKIKEGVGKARRKVGDAIEDVGDKIKE